MKNIKYTLAALAIIAAASFGSAKAQSNGDVYVGVFNSTNSLAFDLGSFSSLTAGKQFDLGNVASLVGSNASFAIVASAVNDSTPAGGIDGGNIVVDSTNQAFLNSQAQGSGLETQESDIDNITSGFNANQQSGGPSAGSNVTKVSYELSSSATSFAHITTLGGANFGLGGSAGVVQSYTGSNSTQFYLVDITNTGTAIAELPFTFSTSGNDTILTYGAVPEPSAYALGLTALALFWVLKRRNSTVA